MKAQNKNRETKSIYRSGVRRADAAGSQDLPAVQALLVVQQHRLGTTKAVLF